MMPPPRRPTDFQEATGPEPSWWELATAGFQDQEVKGTAEETNSLGVATREAWQKLRNESSDEQWARVMGFYNSYGAGRKPIHQAGYPEGGGVTLFALQDYRASLPESERHKIPTTDQLVEQGRQRSLNRYMDAQRTIARAPDDMLSASAIFAGGAGGAIADPANIASMLLVRLPAMGIAKTALAEGVIGGVTQAAIEPVTYDYMNDIGVDYGVDDSINSILQASAGGAAIGGLVRGGEKLVVRAMGDVPIDELRAIERKALAGDPKAIQQYADVVAKRMERAFKPLSETPASAAAAQSVVDDLDAFDRENPFAAEDGAAQAAANARHAAESVRAEEIARTGRATSPPPAGEAPPVRSVTPEGVQMMDLASLKRDAYTFQFKDSDIDGVTPALKGVDTWAPERAGLIIAWENKAGDRFVVDGHQRHALAGRLTENGHAPISAPVYLLREADGVDAATAKAKAAIKNIGEGSGTALDAAYILRSSRPEDLRGLPPNSALVRDAGGLARLSDDAFGMVVNGAADERWGAVVGRLVDEPDLQPQILQAVGRLRPESPAQAESMVRDMLAAPRADSQTLDLFGANQTAELLIAERAKVKAAALSALGKNRTAFKAALQRQVELERQGNHLVADANRKALDVDTAAALRLEKDAHLKGWVSDALSEAAKDLRNGSSLTEVTGRVVEAVRRGEIGGDTGRAGAGGPGRDAEGASGTRQADRDGGGQAPRRAETLEVDLKRSSWRKAQDGADKVQVLVNPTDAALRRLSVLPADAQRSGATQASLRYLRDDAGDLFVWRGDLAIHEEIAEALTIAPRAEGGAGKVSIEDGRALWDGLPDRPGAPVSKKSLREGGPIAWRRELLREDATVDDIERALAWLAGERKDVILEVRDSLVDEPAGAKATKDALLTDSREAIRAYHAKRLAGDELPAGLFDFDPDVARMRAAEERLRAPVQDEGARLAAEAEAAATGDAGRAMADEAELASIEADIKALRQLEESDPRVPPQMFVDPESGKLRPMSAVLDEIDSDRARLKVFEFCAYPGGKGRA